MLRVCLDSLAINCVDFEWDVKFELSPCGKTFLEVPTGVSFSMTTRLYDSPYYFDIPFIPDYYGEITDKAEECGSRIFDIYSSAFQDFLSVDG